MKIHSDAAFVTARANVDNLMGAANHRERERGREGPTL